MIDVNLLNLVIDLIELVSWKLNCCIATINEGNFFFIANLSVTDGCALDFEAPFAVSFIWQYVEIAILGQTLIKVTESD